MKHVSIEELFALNGIEPQFQRREAPPPTSAASPEEIASFYNFHYGPGLDRMLETTWYSSQGLAQLQRNAELHDFVAQCVERNRAKPEDDRQLPSLEARLVWQLACMPRLAQHGGAANGLADHVLQDLLLRIDTLENLLTGGFLPPERIPATPQPHLTSAEYSTQAFWHQLGRFTAVRGMQMRLTNIV